ncbi:MAG TPA: glucosamine-6-phosphate deaminase [Candidatus Acidoferrum sp.]|nr:glucosamine-6-phosphate deaminase [Candidatus Acidoferrum sp.]
MSPIKTFQVDALPVRVYASQDDLACDVAATVQQFLAQTLAERGSAAAILATGNSQIRFLDELIKLGGVDWSKITLFHMDEYLGIDANHKASFRRYMREKVESIVKPKVFHYIKGDADQPLDECARYAELLDQQEIDLCCLGIGENGHIAFNDPHVAEFDDPWAVKLVSLDLKCRQQQVDEGHFASVDQMPQYAYTLTIPTLCAVRKMICISPEKRKANAVRMALTEPVSAACPASYLRTRAAATLLLDTDSAALL